MPETIIIKTEAVSAVIGAMIDSIIKNEVYFCELDSHAGDGDFGMSIAQGFRQLKENWDDLDREDISSFLGSCGMIIIEYCGGASGPIWGSAFKSAARFAMGKTELKIDELPEFFDSAIKGIQKRGGAKLGDKTLLDALIPAVEALKKAFSAGDDLHTAIGKFSKAAKQGAESTKNFIALKGRATYLGERGIGHPDAGAMAVSVIIDEVIDILIK